MDSLDGDNWCQIRNAGDTVIGTFLSPAYPTSTQRVFVPIAARLRVAASLRYGVGFDGPSATDGHCSDLMFRLGVTRLQ